MELSSKRRFQERLNDNKDRVGKLKFLPGRFAVWREMGGGK